MSLVGPGTFALISGSTDNVQIVIHQKSAGETWEDGIPITPGESVEKSVTVP